MVLTGWLDARKERRIWASGLDNEVAFWTAWFHSRGLQYPEDYARRLDPHSELDDALAALLPPDNARVLDVGAGPLTVLGKRRAGKPIDIVAVDALAEAYDAIMAEVGVVPPVRTLKCDAEKLSAMFADGGFDLAHSQNALDHSYDPMRAIAEMLRAVKRGGYAYLRHNRNEAENEGYRGLHQWNFDLREGRFVIWNRSRIIDAQRKFESLADVTVEDLGSQLVVRMRRR